MLRNDGTGRFAVEPLPRRAQLAPIFGTQAFGDLLVAAENSFAPEPETGRHDGGTGLVLRGGPRGIAVVPPDLSVLLPVNTTAPAAKINPAQLYTEFKPRTELGGDLSRIFQQYEVDQRPAVVSRPKPYIPPVVRMGADSLRISVLILVDTRGAVSNVRVLQGSGNKHFDAIILRDIREAWVFSPAMKKGRKVRCLVQQNVRVEWSGGSLLGI